MATLTVFRKKKVPSDTEYGDDIEVVSAGKSIISENLSEQISRGSLSYRTSSKFSEGSTRVFLNGMYMTKGDDYIESKNNFIIFSNELKNLFISSDITTLSVVYSAK